MVWQPEDPRDTKSRLVQQYCKTHEYTDIPWDYIVDGVWLKKWLTTQISRLNEEPGTKGRPAKKLTRKQIDKLASVGILRESESIRSTGYTNKRKNTADSFE